MSRNEVIKAVVEKLHAEKKINSLQSEGRIDTWKVGNSKNELKIEWREKFDTKFSAPKGYVLDQFIAALKARPHV